MSKSGVFAGLTVVGVLVLIVLGAGTVFGVGPLAPAVPADRVTDPKEMIARSLQATLDASAVHFEGTISGSIAGNLVGRPEAAVDLAGTTLDADIRPKDGKTRTHLASDGLEVDMDTVTVWDGAWYRTAPDDPWVKASLGGASAEAGVDINPLTLVDRLRSYLATPGLVPTTREVACASASGRCHEVHLDAGSDPLMILGLMLPHDQAADLPPVDVDLTLQTDALTLRPARLIAGGDERRRQGRRARGDRRQPLGRGPRDRRARRGAALARVQLAHRRARRTDEREGTRRVDSGTSFCRTGARPWSAFGASGSCAPPPWWPRSTP